MASDAEVRAWARDEGLEPPARGKLNPSYHEQYAAAHPGQEQVPEGQTAIDVDGAETPPAPAAGAELDTGETPPRSPRPPRLSVLKGGRRKKPPTRRVSLESVCAAGWSVLSAVATQGGMGPTGRVLAMQAPVAGVILEDAMKGTLADRLLQPIARTAERGSQVGALLGPPVLVSVLTARPELAPQVLPVLRMTLRQWVLVTGPALKAQQRKEARALESLGVEDDQDLNAMIEGMITTIFAPPEMNGVPDAA